MEAVMDLDAVLVLLLALLQQMCIYLAVAYILSRTRLFIPLTRATILWPHRLACYVIFSLFSIMGTLLGLPVVSANAIANTPAIGAVIGGLLGGPVVGLAVGITAGIHRYQLGGSFALAAAIDIAAQGLLGGLTHRHLISRGKVRKLFSPVLVATVTGIGILIELAIDLALSRPFEEALHIVSLIALPELVANTLGAALFMTILTDRRSLLEEQSSAFSAKALRIAARADGLLRSGFDQQNSSRVAQIIYEETGVGAVAITDREKILAFIGIGDDHHLPGTPISSRQTHDAIARNEVFFADGNEVPYRCSLSPTCRLGSSLVIPLAGEDGLAVGTIKLYEPKSRVFSTINRALGEGIAKLLSAQILAGRYERQRALLIQAELKLLHAQVNPHFLFNALNTIAAVIRTDPERGRQLVHSLSHFFRKNLKRAGEEVVLGDELDHVEAYLQIEMARFAGNLEVEVDVPEEFIRVRLPAFSLQPVVENAIKHGTSQLLGGGRVRISAVRGGGDLLLSVEDNAGLYGEKPPGDGLGMAIVDRRIRARHGDPYGIQVECERDVLTRVTLRVPLETVPA